MSCFTDILVRPPFDRTALSCLSSTASASCSRSSCSRTRTSRLEPTTTEDRSLSWRESPLISRSRLLSALIDLLLRYLQLPCLARWFLLRSQSGGERAAMGRRLSLQQRSLLGDLSLVGRPSTVRDEPRRPSARFLHVEPQIGLPLFSTIRLILRNFDDGTALLHALLVLFGTASLLHICPCFCPQCPLTPSCPRPCSSLRPSTSIILLTKHQVSRRKRKNDKCLFLDGQPPRSSMISASDSTMPERSTPSPLPLTSFKRQQSNGLHSQPHLYSLRQHLTPLSRQQQHLQSHRLFDVSPAAARSRSLRPLRPPSTHPPHCAYAPFS